MKNYHYKSMIRSVALAASCRVLGQETECVCVCMCACVFELWGVLDRKYCIGPDVPVGTLHAVLSVYECVHECVLKPSESSKNVYCCSFILKHEIGGTSQLSF